MSDWHDVAGNNPAPHGRLLLLLTKPEKVDAADEFYDVTVGYWHKVKENFVPAFNPATVKAAR
jgi:hypothetical protein